MASQVGFGRRVWIAAALAGAIVLALLPAIAASRSDASSRCYRDKDAVPCLLGIARAKLARISDPDERADVVGDFLYTLATTGNDDDAIAQEARRLSADKSVKPVKQMDLLYSIDLHDSLTSAAAESYRAALARFAALEKQLSGSALVELHVNACAIGNWDEPFRERWLDFAESVCTPERLKAIKADGLASQSLLLATMPIAMTLAEDREGFEASADRALAWLEAAEAATAKVKDGGGRDFVAAVGILMHTGNAQCLAAFEEQDDADAEVDRAVAILKDIEARHGISGKTTPLRRQVVEALFDGGRDAESAKLLRRMLTSVDRDADGRKIPFAEQVAILLLAARLESYINAERDQAEVPAGHIRM
ncbi:MAG TPA: hypothetical protein VF816_07435 [Rhodocyclaceae bacterium]